MAIDKIEVITRSEKRRHYSDNEKKKILAEATSLPVTEVCRKHDIAPSSFYLWKKNFSLPDQALQGVSPQAFAQVAVTQANAPKTELASDPIRLHLYDEIVVELPSSIDPRQLVTMIRSLRR